MCEWSIVVFHSLSDGRTYHPSFCLPLLTTSTGSGNFWRNVPVWDTCPQYSIYDLLVVCFPNCHRFTSRPFNDKYSYITIIIFLILFILQLSVSLYMQSNEAFICSWQTDWSVVPRYCPSSSHRFPIGIVHTLESSHQLVHT